MKKKKKKAIKKRKKKSKKQKLDPNVEEVYEKVITFLCPNRGKVTEKVKVKKYKSFQFEHKHTLKESSSDPISQIEESEAIEELTSGGDNVDDDS